jgi:hypothetical protein
MRHTIGNLVTFVLAHRKNKAFCEYTADDIAHEIQVSIADNGFSYSVSEVGTINGVVTGKAYPDKKLFYVRNILSIEKGVIREFLKILQREYPGFKIAGLRFDKVKNYDTNRLVKHFTK